MPDLIHTLQGRDLGFLKMVAGAWGIELNAPDVRSALPLLTQAMLAPDLVHELVEALPADARRALQTLLDHDGRVTWTTFCREFGEVRSLGAAARDRERPDLRPATVAERLWYRALIGRTFLSTDRGNTERGAPGANSEPLEFAYIPDDISSRLPDLGGGGESAPPGRPASPQESACPRLSDDSIIDEACSLLAALRLKLAPESLQHPVPLIPPAALTRLLAAAGLVDSHHIPAPEATRSFLQAGRGQALARLARRWLESADFNELRLLPGLRCEGEWSNNPRKARRALLDWVARVPEGQWWSLSALVAALRERQPDFQRSGGEYDSWYIAQESTGQFLRGFAAWDEVDGALARFIITGPMFWLGMVDLASGEPEGPPTAFRLTPWAHGLWLGQPPAHLPADLPAEDGKARVTLLGQVFVEARAPRAVRYQVARFCGGLAASFRDGEYEYNITPASLKQARAQGLHTHQLTALLAKHQEAPLPPGLQRALERWEEQGAQAALARACILRLSDPEILTALRRTTAARRLGEALTPTLILVHPGGEDEVLAALAGLGYLTDCRLE